MQTPVANPALQRLAVLVGEWDAAVSFPHDPHTIIRGHASYQWWEAGAFLVMRAEMSRPEFPRVVAIIGRDDAAETYDVLHFDSRGVSRRYGMRLDDRVWEMRRDVPGFSQRFIGTFSDDGTTITGHWDKSSDGTTWERDFDLTYQKTR
jgi:hypothetical protein